MLSWGRCTCGAAGQAEAADTGEVLAAAEERLQQLGAIKPAEATMAAVLLGTLVLWVFGHQLGVAPGLAALGKRTLDAVTGPRVHLWHMPCCQYSQIRQVTLALGLLYSVVYHPPPRREKNIYL